MQTIAVIGFGSWGTALANLLANKASEIKVWDVDNQLLSDVERDRENKKYLPGVILSDEIKIVRESSDAVRDADILMMAVPAQHFASALSANKEYVKKGAIIVNVSKGIEQKSLKTPSMLAAEIIPENEYAILSGPSHAEEVGAGIPTTVAVASAKLHITNKIQDLFMTDKFRVYSNSDVLGVELGGALKNIIALGAGMSDGLGFGDNTKAALMTRGLVEMSRLGTRMGAHADTFFGLSGLGDLIVTCTSVHSRNRRCGIMLGEGIGLKEATEKIGMVVEGVFTVEAAYALAQEYNVEMPIVQTIYKVINGEIPASEGMPHLMSRQKKHEFESLL